MYCLANTWVCSSSVESLTTKNINVLESVNQQATYWALGSWWDSFSQKWSRSSDVFPDCIGLPLRFVEITYVYPYSMIFCTTITPPSNLILSITLYQATHSLYTVHYQLLPILILCECALCLECYSILYTESHQPFVKLYQIVFYWLNFNFFFFLLFCKCNLWQRNKLKLICLGVGVE